MTLAGDNEGRRVVPVPEHNHMHSDYVANYVPDEVKTTHRIVMMKKNN